MVSNKRKKANAAHARANRNKRRSYMLNHNYGLTEEQYNLMFEAQNGVCAICKQSEKRKSPYNVDFSLAVDHCHETGKIRGLLCTNCNKGLGNLKESVSNLIAAAEYIKKNQEDQQGIARRYKDSDFNEISSWAKQWDGSNYDQDLLPTVGYIVPGVAVYFVYEAVGTKQAMLENLITNPKIPIKVKEAGINAVITACLRYCNDNGFKVARAVTDNKSVISRAIKHNAVTEGQVTKLALKFNN